MAKLSALDRKRRVSEMRDRLADYVLSDNPKLERIRAADIALRLSRPMSEHDRKLDMARAGR